MESIKNQIKNIYNGNPCKNCGTNEKYINGRTCVVCAKRRGSIFNKSEKGKEWLKAYRKSEIGKIKRIKSNLKKYGISIEYYNELVKKQKGKCYLCKRLPNSRYNKLYVDHDHKNNKVRKLLCHSCNAALGLFKDDINTLKRAVLYLKG